MIAPRLVLLLLIGVGSCTKKTIRPESSHGEEHKTQVPTQAIEGNRGVIENVAKTVSVLGLNVSLQRCAVMVNGVDVAETTLEEPCRFIEANGQPQTVKTSAGVGLMVASSRPHPEYANRCRTRIKAVFISQTGVKLSASSQDILSCLADGADEMLFHAFAQEMGSSPKRGPH